MQPRNSILQDLSFFKKSMANRRNSKDEDVKPPRTLNNTPAPAARQQLQRRCKVFPPYYAIDNAYVDEEGAFLKPKVKRKRTGLGPSSSGTNKDAGQVLGRLPKRKPANTMIMKQDEEEVNISSNILAWLIEMKVVCDKAKVGYLSARKEVTGGGMITREGIECDCCNELFTASSFSHHKNEGDCSVDKPYENIVVWKTGVSLLTCQIEAWNRHSVPARSGYHHTERRPRVQDNSDDSCVICADGGDLICCEKCPSTYHPKCMGFEGVPQDEWLCPYCQCRHCNKDPSDDMLLTCFQCLKKYHQHCSKKSGKMELWEQPPSIPLCGWSCWRVYHDLEEMLGRSMPLGHGFSWTLVRKMDQDLAGQNSKDLYTKANCNSMVVLASKLMEESFKKIVDRQTRTNTIQSVVYSCGSNFTRTNFSRFYTAILEQHGQIVSVASLRLPSSDVAEIPFITTCEKKRQQGFCRILLGAIESALAYMRVEHIVIPSAEEMVQNWKAKFGFIPLDKAMQCKITNLNTVMFPRTTRLQKAVRSITRAQLDLNELPKEDE